MKKIIYGIFLATSVFTLWFCTSSSSGKNMVKMKDSNELKFKKTGTGKVAVLELFTSQGCSSCPPADRLLGDFMSKENVIALSFHVDYWNRLGWKDPFSSKEYSQRQYNYSSALHSSVYTPQLVVNGESEMVGSDENKISAAIKKIQSEPTSTEISIKKVSSENNKVKINFSVSGDIDNSVLNIALAEKMISTNVKAGENDGSTLTNYNVVRNFKIIKSFNGGEGAADIDLPQGIDLKNLSVVLYVQKKNNLISAADQTSLQ